MTGEDGGVPAQLSQISIELGKQSTTLAVIGTKLDGVVTGFLDHETRIRGLESARAKIIGAATASGILSGAVAGLIAWALTHHG